MDRNDVCSDSNSAMVHSLKLFDERHSLTRPLAAKELDPHGPGVSQPPSLVNQGRCTTDPAGDMLGYRLSFAILISGRPCTSCN